MARKVNGLEGADVQPWHMKASFEGFDTDGKSKSKGTYEEWWVSDKQYRRSYQSSEFSQTEFGTDHGVFRSQNSSELPAYVGRVHYLLVDPVPSEAQISRSELAVFERVVSDTKLRCVSMKPQTAPKNATPSVPPSYCFGIEKPMMRLTTSPNFFDTTLFNRTVRFRGRYLGGDIRMTQLGKTAFTVHLDSLESIRQVNAADFQPPDNAVPAPPRRVSVNGGVVSGQRISNVPVIYPLGAKALRIEGTVVLQVVIGRDGHIADLRAVGGPTQLQAAAIASVRQWVYQSYTLGGEPVEVETQINVVFRL